MATEHQRRSSIDQEGRRAKIRVGDVAGAFTTRRRALFWLLIAFYAVLPLLRMNGAPLVFIDILDRRFYLFGNTFNAQDFSLLFFFVFGGILALFTVTALVGRVWCGWACPQTVFLEGVFRRIERLVEGPKPRQLALDRSPWLWKRLALAALKHGLYLAASLLVAHIFISYFVSLDRLKSWIFGDPRLHWTAFVWMAAITGGLYFDFAWFREQTCVFLCPYGRIQSALSDDDTLLIGYDSRRGEPRGPRRPSGEGPSSGDCVDCMRCVDVCPTGIDIREGLQLECIGCANCVDACDEIMGRLGRAPGLVRYDSLRGLESGAPRRFLRPRIYTYAALLALSAAVGAFFLAARNPFEATLLRQQGAPYVREHGLIRDSYLLHVVNKTPRTSAFEITLALPKGAHAIVPLPQVTVPSLGDMNVPLDVELPLGSWNGEFEVKALCRDLDTGAVVGSGSRFLGPD